jgi:hypothetical protein
LRLGVLGQVAGHVGIDEAGRDHVDGDAAAADLRASDFEKPMMPALAAA